MYKHFNHKCSKYRKSYEFEYISLIMCTSDVLSIENRMNSSTFLYFMARVMF